MDDEIYTPLICNEEFLALKNSINTMIVNKSIDYISKIKDLNLIMLQLVNDMHVSNTKNDTISIENITKKYFYLSEEYYKLVALELCEAEESYSYEKFSAIVQLLDARDVNFTGQNASKIEMIEESLVFKLDLLIKDLALGNGIELIYLAENMHKIKVANDLTSISNILIEMKRTNSTKATIDCARLMFEMMNIHINYSQYTIANNINFVLDEIIIYKRLLEYCNHNPCLTTYIKQDILWREIVSQVPLICKNSLGIIVINSDLEYCARNFRSPKLLETLIFKFIQAYIDKNLLIIEIEQKPKLEFFTTHPDLQKHMTFIKSQRVETNKHVVKEKKQIFVIDTDKLAMRDCINLIMIALENNTDSINIDKFLCECMRAIQTEYVKCLNQEELIAYDKEITIITQESLCLKNYNLTQCLIGMQSLIEREYMTRSMCKSIPTSFRKTQVPRIGW